MRLFFEPFVYPITFVRVQELTLESVTWGSQGA
jgi:hypothetical protein